LLRFARNDGLRGRKRLLLAAALVATPAAAQPTASPKLVVAISVDQLSSELWEQYRPLFTGGLARLAGEGTVFVNGYQSHAATETCPGHSTLLTGRHPAATGIIANSWTDQGAARSDKHVYCAEDETAAGSTFANYQVSPAHLRVTTLGDRLKALSPRSRNVAVAGKDRAAVMMSGRNADGRWYWDGKAWTTDLMGAATPRTISALNQVYAASLAAPRAPLQLPPQCQARAKPYTVAPGLTVGAGRLDRAAGDARGARAHPEFDGAVLAAGAGLVGELQLGRGPGTDVLSLGLSATDYIGHSFGNGGTEMCLQMLALDRSLGDFFRRLDATSVDYAVVLSSDHGVMDLPERLRDNGVAQAQRAEAGLATEQVGKLLAPQFGWTESVLRGEGIGGDVWIDRSLPPATRTRVLRAAAERYRAHPQVYAAYTADQLRRLAMPSGSPDKWSVVERVRASFDPARSGDLIVVLKQYVSPIAAPTKGYVATHGSPWDYDRRVPIVFWRKGAGGGVRPEAVGTVDILPTVGALIGLAVPPATIDGRCLGGAAGARCPA
jgi:predicted AlkP superfamily pyrophosphatase or phosphodiesterase